jgi:hypothetical protein
VLTLALVLVLCGPVTVDAVAGSMARVETRCGWYHVPAAPWLSEGMTTAPWRRAILDERRRALPIGPAGDLVLDEFPGESLDSDGECATLPGRLQP